MGVSDFLFLLELCRKPTSIIELHSTMAALKDLGLPIRFKFIKSAYGHYSRELDRAIKVWEKMGFLERVVEGRTPNIKITFRTTPRGEKIIESAVRRKPSLRLEFEKMRQLISHPSP